ncbi:hypothetical protein [Helicobacter sp. UBA3407]|uniref:hypothetical protein n=1 Tax=Helicobacter sp. UBA3407 TaxID=1946588 RepID=UPI0026328A8B|nr:hypothetical protein [Helicobacter sp. UBA3407]
MISGIDSGSVVASGNLNVLKKAIQSEEALMSSLINGMQNTQANLFFEFIFYLQIIFYNRQFCF